MKFLKGLLIAIAALIVLVLASALFMDKKYLIEREITIRKPKAEVFEYIKHIDNQDNFSKWNMADPTKKTDKKGTDGTVGYIYAWDGNDEVGAGEQEITKITEGERIDVALRFKRPLESNAKAYMATEAITPTSTKVKWAMYGESSYPMNVTNFMSEMMLGGDLEAGLANLKTVLEKQ